MPLERGSSKSFQEIGLITQQPLGVGAGRVEFSGISAAASTSQASAKSRSVQKNPKAALTFRAGESGGGRWAWGGNQWPQNIDLELVTSCHFIRWQQSPGNQPWFPRGLSSGRLGHLPGAPHLEQLQIPPHSDSKSVSWPLHSALLSTNL